MMRTTGAGLGLAAVIAIALGVVGCKPSGGAAPPAQAAGATTASGGNTAPGPAGPAPPVQAASTSPTIQGNTATGPAYQVAVTLSPAAAAKIASSGETVLVYTTYYGDATQAPASQRLADEGKVFVGKEEDIELRGAGVASFKGPSYDTGLLADMVDRQVDVWIQVVSGRHTNPDNFLDCDTIDEVAITSVAATAAQIHCKLIGEP